MWYSSSYFSSVLPSVGRASRCGVLDAGRTRANLAMNATLDTSLITYRNATRPVTRWRRKMITKVRYGFSIISTIPTWCISLWHKCFSHIDHFLWGISVTTFIKKNWLLFHSILFHPVVFLFLYKKNRLLFHSILFHPVVFLFLYKKTGFSFIQYYSTLLFFSSFIKKTGFSFIQYYSTMLYFSSFIKKQASLSFHTFPPCCIFLVAQVFLAILIIFVLVVLSLQKNI